MKLHIKKYRNKLNHILKYTDRKHFRDILEPSKYMTTYQMTPYQVNQKFKLNDWS